MRPFSLPDLQHRIGFHFPRMCMLKMQKVVDVKEEVNLDL
jgi:hypothetical protein